MSTDPLVIPCDQGGRMHELRWNDRGDVMCARCGAGRAAATLDYQDWATTSREVQMSGRDPVGSVRAFVEHGLTVSAAQAGRLLVEYDRLAAQRATVLALHRVESIQCEDENGMAWIDVCNEDGCPWPCDTAVALGVVDV